MTSSTSQSGLPQVGEITEQMESPPPDALAPEALREELITIVLRSTQRGREVAETTVDHVLAKLAVYYAAAATPEVVAEAPQTFAIIQELAHAVERAITAGAACSQAWSENSPQRGGWQRAAKGLRDSFNRLMGALS